MARIAVIPESKVEEEIQSVFVVEGEDGSVNVAIGVGKTNKDGKFEFDLPQSFVNYSIEGDDYKALMSEFPEWSPKKPKGTFRKEDIWAAIDHIRSKKKLTKGS